MSTEALDEIRKRRYVHGLTYPSHLKFPASHYNNLQRHKQEEAPSTVAHSKLNPAFPKIQDRSLLHVLRGSEYEGL